MITNISLVIFLIIICYLLCSVAFITGVRCLIQGARYLNPWYYTCCIISVGSIALFLILITRWYLNSGWNDFEHTPEPVLWMFVHFSGSIITNNFHSLLFKQIQLAKR